jgi:hypothetical protein
MYMNGAEMMGFMATTPVMDGMGLSVKKKAQGK